MPDTNINPDSTTNHNANKFITTHPIDIFFESYGFYGGRYITVMFLLIFITLIYFALQWRSTNNRLVELHSKIDFLLEEIQILNRKLK